MIEIAKIRIPPSSHEFQNGIDEMLAEKGFQPIFRTLSVTLKYLSLKAFFDKEYTFFSSRKLLTRN